MTYVSSRGIPLLCQTPWEHGPIITAENHNKWYSLFVLHPDGSVSTVDVKDIIRLEEKDNMNLYIEHNFNPKLLYLLAAELKGEVDWLTNEVVTGRWVHEVEDKHVWMVEEFQ